MLNGVKIKSNLAVLCEWPRSIEKKRQAPIRGEALAPGATFERLVRRAQRWASPVKPSHRAHVIHHRSRGTVSKTCVAHFKHGSASTRATHQPVTVDAFVCARREFFGGDLRPVVITRRRPKCAPRCGWLSDRKNGSTVTSRSDKSHAVYYTSALSYDYVCADERVPRPNVGPFLKFYGAFLNGPRSPLKPTMS